MSILRLRYSRGAFFIINPLFNLFLARYIYGMKPFVDAHCHYDAAAFAKYSGAGYFICNAARESDWAPLLSGAARNRHIIPALGLHPWYVTAAADGWAGRLRDILEKYPDVMVGEIGLDAGRENMDAQYDAFVTQYQMAASLGRGVHIHCVRAWDRMTHVLKTCTPPPLVVMHRYSGSAQIMADLISSDANIYFSYNSASGGRLHNLIDITPSDRILVETDAAKPDSDTIFDVISQMAATRGVSIDGMAQILYDNGQKVIKNG